MIASLKRLGRSMARFARRFDFWGAAMAARALQDRVFTESLRK